MLFLFEFISNLDSLIVKSGDVEPVWKLCFATWDASDKFLVTRRPRCCQEVWSVWSIRFFSIPLGIPKNIQKCFSCRNCLLEAPDSDMATTSKYAGLCWSHVEPMLGHLEVCWAYSSPMECPCGTVGTYTYIFPLLWKNADKRRTLTR